MSEYIDALVTENRRLRSQISDIMPKGRKSTISDSVESIFTYNDDGFPVCRVNGEEFDPPDRWVKLMYMLVSYISEDTVKKAAESGKDYAPLVAKHMLESIKDYMLMFPDIDHNEELEGLGDIMWILDKIKVSD